MREKKYDPQLVDVALDLQSEALTNPETFRSQIERLVDKGIQKGTSKKLLQYELQIKYPEAKIVVAELLVDYDDCGIISKKAPELLKKYSHSNHDEEREEWSCTDNCHDIDLYSYTTTLLFLSSDNTGCIIDSFFFEDHVCIAVSNIAPWFTVFHYTNLTLCKSI